MKYRKHSFALWFRLVHLSAVSEKFALDTMQCCSQLEENDVGRHYFFSSFVVCVLSQMVDTACVSVDSGLIPSPVKSETLI